MPSSVVRQTAHWISEHDPLPVVRWSDPLIEDLGYEAGSRYVETYWAPALGPSAIAVLRRLSEGLASAPDGLVVPLGELSRAIGLGGTIRPDARLVLALARIADFGFAMVDGERYAVRSSLPPLTRRQMARLPRSVAAAHDAEFDDELDGRAPLRAALVVELEHAKAEHRSSSTVTASDEVCECVGRPS
jgi:hypothetical protein